MKQTLYISRMFIAANPDLRVTVTADKSLRYYDYDTDEMVIVAEDDRPDLAITVK